MRSPAHWLADRLAAQPVATDKAIAASLGMAVAVGWAHLSDVQVGAVIAAYSAWSLVLVWPAVTPNTKVDEKAEQQATTKANAREAEIHDYLAALQAAEADRAGRSGLVPPAPIESRRRTPHRARPEETR